MVNLVRKRKASRLDFGLTPAGVGVADPVSAARFQEIHDNLEALDLRLRTLQESIPGAVEETDYTGLFDEFWAAIQGLREDLEGLEDEEEEAGDIPRLFAHAKNTGGTNLGKNEVGIVQGQIYGFTEPDFFSKVHLEIAIAGVAEEEDAPFVVCMEDIDAGASGQVCLMGVVPAYVYGGAGDAALTFARVEPSSAALKLHETGTAEIFERDTSGDITVPHLALIRFMYGAGGAGVYIVANYAALPDPATVGDGALGYTEDKDYFYGVRAGAWRILHPFKQTTAPSGIGEADGDLWYDTDTSPYQVYARCNGAWYGIVFSI